MLRQPGNQELHSLPLLPYRLITNYLFLGISSAVDPGDLRQRVAVGASSQRPSFSRQFAICLLLPDEGYLIGVDYIYFC